MNETQLVQSIKKYLATVPECFFWKEHGGQYGTAGIPDRKPCTNSGIMYTGKRKKTGLNGSEIRWNLSHIQLKELQMPYRKVSYRG